MADDPTPEPKSDPPHVLAPEPFVIPVEATEFRASEREPSAPSTATDAEAQQAAAAAETVSDTATPEAPEASSASWETQPTPNLMREPRSERTSGASFVSGLVGAVVGAAVVAGVVWYFESGSEPAPDLSARLSALEAHAAAPASSDPALVARIGALEAAQAGFAKATTLDAIEKELARLESTSVKPESVAAALAEARAARGDAAKALAQASAAAQGSEKLAPAPTPDPRIAEIASEEAALRGRVDKLEASLGGRIDKLDASIGGRVDALEASLGDRIGKTESTLGERIGKIEAALSAPKAETRVPPTEVAPKVDAAGQAIAALALEQRLRSGAPFTAEWAALSRLGADPAALAALKPFSNTGVPTAAALGASFAKIAPALVATANPETSDGGLDKMLDKMRKLVRVRAVGEVAGEDPAALVTQIQAALARGQIESALDLYARLPEPARKAAADWAKTARAGVEADSVAQTLRATAVAGLAAPKN
jgi:hypothetical protein